MKIKFTAHACRWFDKINGNTYHSVRITRNSDGKQIVVGFTYGYGESYRYSALEAMSTAKWLPVKYRGINKKNLTKSWNYERENNYPIQWTVSDGLKRYCVENGEL